jgi:hypothetical protein
MTSPTPSTPLFTRTAVPGRVALAEGVIAKLGSEIDQEQLDSVMLIASGYDAPLMDAA